MATHQLNEWDRCNICNRPVCLVPSCPIAGHDSGHPADPNNPDAGATCSEKCHQYAQDIAELT